MARPDGREPDELRPVNLVRRWSTHPEGSVLVSFGDTRVLCTASVVEGVPRWRKGSGLGWVTAEYAMLPARHQHPDRAGERPRPHRRAHPRDSRLIGRSLRACVDFAGLGENTIVLDCDVLQADGGTRTAAITGAYVALHDAITWMAERELLAGAPRPLRRSVAAVSVGVVGGEPRLDLGYEEDVAAEVDMNVICTGAGEFVEVQGTGEGERLRPRAARRAARPRRWPAVPGSPRRSGRRWPSERDRRGRGRWRAACCWRPATPRSSPSCSAFWTPRRLASGAAGRARRRPAYAEAPETGLTFAENALLKAREGSPAHRAADRRGRLRVRGGRAQRHARGAPRPLGRPARRRRANLELVLDQVADVPDERRGAAFVCAAALVAARRAAGGTSVEGGARPADPRAARRQRLRLRPDLCRGRAKPAPTPSCRRRRRTRSATGPGVPRPRRDHRGHGRAGVTVQGTVPDGRR